MKRTLLICLAVFSTLAGFSQVDTTTKTNEADTIRVGGMIIIRKKGNNNAENKNESSTNVTITNRRNEKPSNVSTNWWILDIGFSNFVDNTTNYNTLAPGLNEENFKLRTGKSRNVNVWFFMQQLNMIEHVVNLKYGMGLELNNYFFDDTHIRFAKNPTLVSLAADDVKKAKLAADYLTVPIMLNFNMTPNRKKGFGFSAGVSGGYLYSARFKTKDHGSINKVKDDFDLKRWKLSYIGELTLGPVRLYGSYAMNNMWEKGFDMTPYTVGIRLSHF